MALLEFTASGIYCPQAGIYIDPVRPVEKALITHAHADHARPGHRAYCCHPDSVPFLQDRLGKDIAVETASYGTPFSINGVRFSFHPAGHMVGSAQVRVEQEGEVWVVTGDYKVLDDGLASPFEAVPCHTLITECTFGLPVYRFPDPNATFQAIREWWQECRDTGRTAVLFGYSLGKAQRLMHGLGEPLAPIYVHGAIQRGVELYRSLGYALPEVHPVKNGVSKKDLEGALAVAPPSALGTGWLKRFPQPSLGMASGWMRVRGNRRQRSVDRGFVLSDHADWNGLDQAIRASGPERVITSHGFNDLFAEWLREQGYEAHAERDLYESEEP